MYKDVLQAIAGIEIYPVISLLIFVAAFTLILVRLWRMDRVEIERFSRLPLDDNTVGVSSGRNNTDASLAGRE
jgi:hypothetical protein